MNILHLANDFSGSKVYQKLCLHLDSLGIGQVVYSAVRNKNLIGKNSISFNAPESKVIFSHILNRFTRIHYHWKVRRVIADIRTTLEMQDYSAIHAHTWYSDGAVAYELHRTFGIPYIVTVRNTDLNFFFPYMFHLRGYAMEILAHAEAIVFIVPIYRDRFFAESYVQKFASKLIGKVHIIPNGIDSFWINNIKPRKSKSSGVFRVLYIGRFDRNKNIMRLIEAVKTLREAGINVTLDLVGGGGNEDKRVLQVVRERDYFTLHGQVHDKNVLMGLFMDSDLFAMPSVHETFGLVYLEALSQGVPVLYTRNEGIDGLYDHIGEAVDCFRVDSIATGIETLCRNYDKYTFDPLSIVSNHNWQIIAKRYISIYQGII